MCHERFVDGGLWVTAPALLHHLPLHNRAGQGRLPIEILEARTGPLFWSWMVQDGRHTKLHLEVQKIIPGVFEEQILRWGKENVSLYVKLHIELKTHWFLQFHWRQIWREKEARLISLVSFVSFEKVRLAGKKKNGIKDVQACGGMSNKPFYFRFHSFHISGKKQNKTVGSQS